MEHHPVANIHFHNRIENCAFAQRPSHPDEEAHKCLQDTKKASGNFERYTFSTTSFKMSLDFGYWLWGVILTAEL